MAISSSSVIWLRSLSTLVLPVTAGMPAPVCASATPADKIKSAVAVFVIFIGPLLEPARVTDYRLARQACDSGPRLWRPALLHSTPNRRHELVCCPRTPRP